MDEVLTLMHRLENILLKREIVMTLLHLRTNDIHRWLHELWSPIFTEEIQIELDESSPINEIGQICYEIYVPIHPCRESFQHTLGQLTVHLKGTVQEVCEEFSYYSPRVTVDISDEQA